MKYFDERVAFAVQNLWVMPNAQMGAEALKRLKEAADDGVADAYYFLGRCFSGSCFVDPMFSFAENDDLANEYYDKSILMGSAVGMFGAMRVGGYKPPKGTFIHPPYNSIKEVWDAVNEYVEAGNTFCMYMVGNAYFYGDVMDFLGINPTTVPDFATFERYEHDWIMRAIDLFGRCINAGMYSALPNLINIYSNEHPGLPPQPQKVKELEEFGVQRGINRYEGIAGRRLYDAGQYVAADEMLRRALAHGNKSNIYWLGKMHTYNGQLQLDLPLAKHCFELALMSEYDNIGSWNNLGQIYFYGGQGIQPDYYKAFDMLRKAYEGGNDWGTDMYGTCFLKGLGGALVDYARAKELFLLRQDKPLSVIGLGEIYAYGLGVPENISAAMKCWNKYPNDPRVIENKKNFQKTMFGWKRK